MASTLQELMDSVGKLTAHREAVDTALQRERAALEAELLAVGLKGEVTRAGIKAGISYPKPSAKITDKAGLVEYVAAVWPSEVMIREVPAETVTEVRGAFLAELIDRMAAGRLTAVEADELAEYLKIEQGKPHLRVTLLAAQSAEGE